MSKTLKLTEYTVDQITRLVGIGEKNLELIEKQFDINIILRGEMN